MQAAITWGHGHDSGPGGAHCPGSTRHACTPLFSSILLGCQQLTSAQKQDIIRAVQARHSVHSHTLVAGLWLQQQQVAADLPIHQEVVLEEVQHSVWELQGRTDLLLPGSVGDALKETEAGGTGVSMEARLQRGQWRPLPHASAAEIMAHLVGPKANLPCEP